MEGAKPPVMTNIGPFVSPHGLEHVGLTGNSVTYWNLNTPALYTAAIKNSEFFEVLVPYEYFDFGLKEPIKIVDGFAQLPEGPGLGIDLDWDFIDNSTFEIK